MKDGTAYGGRVKKAFAKLRQDSEKPEIPEADDPMRRLAVAILGMESTDDEAIQATERALEHAADWNEIRVSTAQQVQEMLGRASTRGVDGSRRLIAALQSIYNKENVLSLDQLRGMGRRDAKQYLESLEGVDEYAVASVVLWSLGGHAIPVNDRLLGVLRDSSLVHPQADRAEVQAFLERHVNAAEAKEFCILSRSLSASKRPAPRKAKVAKAPGAKKKQQRAS